jgi:hypothetical protein
MSSTKPAHEGPAPDLSSDVRALSPRPNLEHERKQAKLLLDQLKAGDPEALARLRKHKRDSSGSFQLADAQFTIAREYGFTSWPRLVEYFETLERHEVIREKRDQHPSIGSLESWAGTILADHKQRRMWVASYFSAYVPRFHGRSPEQVLASQVTSDDAKLATARMYRYPSWEVMVSHLQQVTASQPYPGDAWTTYDSPVLKASRAFRDGKLDEVERLVSAHPELLGPDTALAHDVILREIKEPSAASRRAYDWLAERTTLQPALNRMILGHMRMQPEHMQRLLDLGADPHWVPPNGYSVLEHVIARAWSGGVVDLIAERVEPRAGFWISAGLGHAGDVGRYFDAQGVLTDEARNNRPDFTALGAMPLPQNPAPSDEEIIWEAFLIAAFNDRFAVLDVLLDRGFPIDYIGWGQPVLHFAVGEGRVELLQYLIKRGANLDLKGWRPHMSARELAEQHFLNPHGLPNAARVLELCGGRDPETLKREREERRAQRVMQTAPHVEKAFNYAKQDAVPRGLTSVDQESLFIGLLREAGMTVTILADAGVDLGRLRAALADRLEPVTVDVPADMTANPEVSAILLDARTTAEQRKHEILAPLHVFHALILRASRPVLTIIEAAGGSKEKLLPKIERTLNDW